jgi:hypothetical protein
MAFITVSAERGCRTDEIARAVASRLHFRVINESQIDSLVDREFGGPVPPKAWTPAVTSVVARIGIEHHLVVAIAGSEHLFPKIPGVLRVGVVARQGHRAGNLMLDRRTDRASASAILGEFEVQERKRRTARFGRGTVPAHHFDLMLNAESLDPERMAAVIESAATARGLAGYGLLSAAAESQLQFQARLQLARYGIIPAAKAALANKGFSHPSEQMFANLLDFYRISWNYEPRSFPLQWDKDGKVIEAFTPDFYLPEADLYIELTTMKQALVTRKNHKVKLLKAIYPHVNIQVFYQRDFQDLVFKYGLEAREIASDAGA